MSTDPQAFWDHVHKAGLVKHLGQVEFEHYSEAFSPTGPFDQDLSSSSSILDVGPGLARFLLFLREKDRYAIEISGVNRDKLEEAGIRPYAPGEIGEVGVDLATCLSVVQHCKPEAVEVLFSDVSRALRPKGKFYVNGVQDTKPSSRTDQLAAGRFSLSPDQAYWIAESHGFSVLGMHTKPVGPLVAWYLRLEKG